MNDNAQKTMLKNLEAIFNDEKKRDKLNYEIGKIVLKIFFGGFFLGAAFTLAAWAILS